MCQCVAHCILIHVIKIKMSKTILLQQHSDSLAYLNVATFNLEHLI
jgi:uncharacterized membrane protein